MDWNVNHVKGHVFQSLIMKCSLAAAFYHVWMKRNQRTDGVEMRVVLPF